MFHFLGLIGFAYAFFPPLLRSYPLLRRSCLLLNLGVLARSLLTTISGWVDK